MVKLCAADLPAVIDKFRGTYEGLWNDDKEFELCDRASEDCRSRLRKALRALRHAADAGAVVSLFTLQPFPFQLEILDRLDAERAVHGCRRNLLVAATGTGKTVIAS